MLQRKESGVNNYTWVDYLSAILGTTGVVLGTIALTKETSEAEENFTVEGDLEVDNDATVQNNLTVGQVSKSSPDSKLGAKPKGLHLHGEFDMNNSSFRINDTAITTNLHYLSSYDIQARDIHATRDLQIDGKFVYLDVLEAHNGLDVIGDLKVNGADFAVYRNFGSGYVGLTIPIQSNSTILATTLRATSDVIVDGDLYVTGSFDYKSTLVASGGLDVTGALNMNAGDLVINETKMTSTIPIESTSDITCDNLNVVSIFDVNTSAFRVDTKVTTSLDFETTANVVIDGTVRFNGKISNYETIRMMGGSAIFFDDTKDTGFLGIGGNIFYWHNGTPIGLLDGDGIRLNSGSFRALGGSAAEPAFEIFPENGTGMFSPTTSELGFSCGATSVLELTATEADFKIPIHVPYGAFGAPSITFSSDPDTGIWGALGTLHVSTGGSIAASFDASNVTLQRDLLAPSFGFLTATTTGIFMPSVGELDLQAGGVVVAHLTSTEADWKVPLLAQNGTQLAPSYSFESAASTGLFLDSGDIVLSRGNSEVSRFGADGLVLPVGGSIFGGSLSFSGDPNTGLYSPGADEVIFLAGGQTPLRLDATRLLTGLPLFVPDGTALAPSIGFNTQQSTGFFFPVIDSLSVSTGGSESFRFGNAANESFEPLVLPSGAVTTPSLYFTGDSNTGFYSSAANEIAVTCNGFQTARFSETDFVVNSTLSIASGGSSLSPSLSVQGDSNTGIYAPGADQLAIVTNGAEAMVAKSNAVEFKHQVSAPNGDEMRPGYCFGNFIGTGMYSPTSDTISFTCNEADALNITETLAYFAGKVNVANEVSVDTGTALAPAYTFSSDLDTGIYSVAADQLGFSVGGVQQMVIVNGAAQFLDGSPTNPSICFRDDSQCGFYRKGINQIAYVSGGFERWACGSGAFTTRVANRAINGTAGEPSYSFDSNQNTGMYRPAVNQLGFSVDGVQRMVIGAVNMTSTVTFRNIDGTQSAPSYSFSSGTGAGMWTPGGGVVTFSSGAIERFRIDNGVTNWSNTTSVQFPDGSESVPIVSFTNDASSGLYRNTGGFSATSNATEVASFKDTAMEVKVPLVSTNGLAQNLARISGTTITLDSSHTHVQLTTTSPATVTLPASSSVNNGHIISIRVSNIASSGTTVQPDGSDKINGETHPVGVRGGAVKYFCLDKSAVNWMMLCEYRNPRLDFYLIPGSPISPGFPMPKYYFANAGVNVTINLPASDNAFIGDEVTVVCQNSYTITLVPFGTNKINGVNANYVVPAGESRKVFLLGSTSHWSVF